MRSWMAGSGVVMGVLSEVLAAVVHPRGAVEPADVFLPGGHQGPRVPGPFVVLGRAPHADAGPGHVETRVPGAAVGGLVRRGAALRRHDGSQARSCYAPRLHAHDVARGRQKVTRAPRAAQSSVWPGSAARARSERESRGCLLKPGLATAEEQGNR